MRKIIDVIITILALAEAVFLVVYTGSSFGKLRAGAVELAPDESFAQAAEAGTYVTYEAAWPMGSYVDGYYADGTRVDTMGYVVYDRDRSVFLYVIVGSGRTGKLNRLLNDIELSDETVTITGTIELMDDEMRANAKSALDEYLNHRISASGSEDAAFYSTLRTTGNAQTAWYYIRDKKIDGFGSGNLWVSIIGAVVCFVVFLWRTIVWLARRPAKCPFSVDSENSLEKFLATQWDWIVSWVQHANKRNKKWEFLLFLVPVALFVAVGIMVGYDIPSILTMHAPLGMMLGEVSVSLSALVQRSTMKPDRLMLLYRDGIVRALPSPIDQRHFAEELLTVDDEWIVEERAIVHYTMFHFIVGPRYWVFFAGGGDVQVIDSYRLQKIRTVAANIFPLYFWYQGNKRNKADEMVPLRWESTQGKFILLARERLGGRQVEIEAR